MEEYKKIIESFPGKIGLMVTDFSGKVLAKENKEFGFVKVNADTSYGRYLIIRFKGRYVPYIIMTNSKTKRSVNISHSCVMDDVCLLRAMKSFN